jgi:MFS superfamily sulfate permease-like transporter
LRFDRQSLSEAMGDARAGIALAAMNIPQVLGYTRIAGMPVVTGLYTLLLPVLAFAALGSSRYLVPRFWPKASPAWLLWLARNMLSWPAMWRF